MTTHNRKQVRMFTDIRIIVVLVCMGIGFAPQFSWAIPPQSGKDFFSFFRSYQSPVVRNTAAATDGATAASNHRMARIYADQNDIAKANTYFGLALNNATPRQVSMIASDYASFLLNTGDFPKAEVILRQALTQSPDDRDVIRMLAQCLVKQDRMTEGLRYFKSICSESEAREEIVAIYREQGNAEMLAAMERKWGTANPAPSRPEPFRTEPVLIATAPRPAMPQPATLPSSLPARTLTPPPAPAVVASVVRTLPPVPATETPKNVTQEVPLLATRPAVVPLQAEFFDTKVPIPVPRGTPLPTVAVNNPPKPVAAPVPILPAPIPVAQSAEKPALTNPVRLAIAPRPNQVFSEEKEPPRPAVAIQPRRHYVANAGTSANLDILFPIKPASATLQAE